MDAKMKLSLKFALVIVSLFLVIFGFYIPLSFGDTVSNRYIGMTIMLVGVGGIFTWLYIYNKKYK